jgi:DNA mismatch repair protein MutS
MTLVDDYFEYTKKYINSHGPKTIVLMQVGSFFECYATISPDGTYKGSLIQEFSRINDMSIAKKNVCCGGNDVVMAGFGLGQLDKYVKKLLENGYTVPVFVQDIQGKNTTRSLACIYSPGTYFNGETLDNNFNENRNYNSGLSNNTIVIWVDKSEKNIILKEPTLNIGLSIIDILTGKLVNYEYSHPYIDSPTAYDELEKYISIYNPSEIIIITNICDDYKGFYIDTLINYANIHAQKIHKIYLKKDEKDNNINDFLEIAFNCEKQLFKEALIDKIYGIGSYQEKAEFRDYIYANQSLCFLLDFIYKHNPSLIKDIDYPTFENYSEKLVLANHSLKQLNIISDQRYNGKLSCVANFLNNCITNSGKRRFNYELLHPISNVTTLENCYEVTDHLLKTEFYKTIRNDLIGVRDIEKIERKSVIKNISPKDFSILYDNLSNVGSLYSKISNEKQNKHLFHYINSIINCNIYNLCNSYMKFIEDRFNLIKASNIVMEKLGNYALEDLDFINKDYNKNLNLLFKNSIDAREQLQAICGYLSRIICDYEKPKNLSSNTNKKTKPSNKKKSIDDFDNINDSNDNEDSPLIENSYVKIHETSKNDAMLILTKRRAMILKECISKLIGKNNKNEQNINVLIMYKSKYSNNDETLSLNLSEIEFKPHGNNQNNMIIYSNLINEIAHSIQNSKDTLISGINYHYANILNEFNTNNNKNNNLSIISQFIGLIDLCHCKAYNANKYNYCRPKILDKDYGENLDPCTDLPKSYISFKKMRHCLIEHLNNNELYVTNNLDLGNIHNGMLLYGTNAVGKTSFIKSIGIALIMAQSGMYVPCSEFTYYPYSYLFTRILGNDNIFKGLSTFAVEMSELRTILKQSTKNSIILGDELCSGTESTSALSIFVSSLEKLHTIESTFLFATHFHEILDYDEIKELQKMKTYHMSVIFDREKNTLIYDRKLKEGPGEAMYGLEVCKSLDLPHDFIERAYTIRNKYSIENKSTLNAKKSHYNSKKIRDICEICKINKGTEIHHLQYQKNANNEGIINGEFKKNHKANLINICEVCHNKIHNLNKEYKIKKSTKGYQLIEL